VNASGSGFRHLDDREVHRGHVWNVVVATFETPDGVRFERDVVRSPGAVATVPISYDAADADRRQPLVTLIRQYRAPFDEFLLEIPAGMRDVEGEPDEVNARRELVEEVGLEPGAIEELTVSYQSPGMSDSAIAIFLATDCTPVERTPHGPEEQFAEVLTVPLTTAIDWILAGRIRNSSTVIGLLLAERRLLR
jgi:ADP-ribose pyrophosphatase